jgi:hypothetical protein
LRRQHLLDVKVKLKDERTALIREFQIEDKEKFIEMYESLSAEAVRWGMPPYTRERLEKGWLSNLQNLISIVAFYNDKIVGACSNLQISSSTIESHRRLDRLPSSRLPQCGIRHGNAVQVNRVGKKGRIA